MLQAIDMHTHVYTGEKAKLRPNQVTGGRVYIRNKPRMTPDEMAELYQRLHMWR